MANDDTLFEYLRDANTVHIVTTTHDGRKMVTPIWAVPVDDAIYVRSVNGPDAMWYRRATRNPGVGFETPDGVRAVELEAVHDADLERRYEDALRAKYAGEPEAMAPMLKPLPRGTTHRVVPA